MSAGLSRRYGRVCGFPPLADAALDDKLALAHLTANRFNEFDDLPERYQRLILEAEANRQRAIAGRDRTADAAAAADLPAAHRAAPIPAASH